MPDKDAAARIIEGIGRALGWLGTLMPAVIRSGGMATMIPNPTPLPEPLRLPRGSVRGLLAVAVSLTFGYLLVRGFPREPVVVNAVIVAVAFYFGSGAVRSSTGATPTDREGRRFVRVLILLGYGGLAAWFLKDDPSLAALPSELLAFWQVLGGYVLGLTLSWLIHRKAEVGEFRRRLTVVFRDLSAAGALGLTGFICYGFATSSTGMFADRAEDLLSLIITYYFGSRVIGH